MPIHPNRLFASASVMALSLGLTACGSRSKLDSSGGAGGSSSDVNSSSATGAGDGGSGLGGGGFGVGGFGGSPFPEPTCTQLAVEGMPRTLTLPDEASLSSLQLLGTTPLDEVALGATLQQPQRSFAGAWFDGWGAWPAEDMPVGDLVAWLPQDPHDGPAEATFMLGGDGSLRFAFRDSDLPVPALRLGSHWEPYLGPVIVASATPTALYAQEQAQWLTYLTETPAGEFIQFETYLVEVVNDIAGQPTRIGCSRQHVKSVINPAPQTHMITAPDGSVLLAVATQAGGCPSDGPPQSESAQIDTLRLPPPGSGAGEPPALMAQIPCSGAGDVTLLPRQGGAWAVGNMTTGGEFGSGPPFVHMCGARITWDGALVSTSDLNVTDFISENPPEFTIVGGALVSVWGEHDEIRVELHDEEGHSADVLKIPMDGFARGLSVLPSPQDDALLVAWSEKWPDALRLARVRCVLD